MNDDIDELDRALFALPLEAPPPGLRGAILRSTVGAARAPFTRTLPFGTWDIAGIGAALAIALWFVLTCLGNPNLAATFTTNTLAAVSALYEPATLLWLAVGGAVVAWFTVGNAVVENRLVRGRS